MKFSKNFLSICFLTFLGCSQDSNSESITAKALEIKEGSVDANFKIKSDNGNYYDVRYFGVVPDKKTDWTNKIHQIINEIGPSSTLYIPSGVDWNYKGIYGKMKDYQTIIDDSGRDKPRDVWQNSRYIWYRTNSATEKTSGNTFGIAGDYHPAFFIDTWADKVTNGRKASVIFRDHGIAKWQLALDRSNDVPQFAISQYGSEVYGTKNLIIGHQDGPAWGKYAFNAPLNGNTSASYSFGKPQSVKENESFSLMYSRPDNESGGFTEMYKHGNTVTFRTDFQKDGTKVEQSKEGAKIVTTSKGAISGDLLKVISVKSNSSLTKADSGVYISNINASNSVIVSLPKAEVGIYYIVSVDNKYSISVKPESTDSFVGSAPGKILRSNILNSKLKLVAVNNNTWSIDKIGVWE